MTISHIISPVFTHTLQISSPIKENHFNIYVVDGYYIILKIVISLTIEVMNQVPGPSPRADSACESSCPLL